MNASCFSHLSRERLLASPFSPFFPKKIYTCKGCPLGRPSRRAAASGHPPGRLWWEWNRRHDLLPAHIAILQVRVMVQPVLWRGAWQPRLSQNYLHIYPRWDIAFARVFDYTDSQEDCPVGFAREQLLGTPITIAPVIGTARVVSAAGNILKALILAEEAAETSTEDGQSTKWCMHLETAHREVSLPAAPSIRCWMLFDSPQVVVSVSKGACHEKIPPRCQFVSTGEVPDLYPGHSGQELV